MFYYEEFFRTALNGIDRSNIMPVTIQIAQVVLLITFLVAVYESFLRGGDVRMLGIAAFKYIGVGFVLVGYAVVFRDINRDRIVAEAKELPGAPGGHDAVDGRHRRLRLLIAELGRVHRRCS